MPFFFCFYLPLRALGRLSVDFKLSASVLFWHSVPFISVLIACSAILLAAWCYTFVRCLYYRTKSEQLAESEERFRLLSNSAYEGMLIHRDGMVVDANEAACRMMQLDRSSMTGRGIVQLFAACSADAPFDGLFCGDQRCFETEIRRGDGSVLLLEVEPKKTATKASQLEVVLIKEITECKKVQYDLRDAKEKAEQRREQLELVTDNLPVFISRINKDLEYMFVNKTYSRITGLPANEVNGRSIREVIGENAFTVAYPMMKRALDGERVCYENVVKDVAGTDIHLLVDYIPEFHDGQVVGFFILSVDVTDRRTAEANLRVSEEKFAKAFHNSPVLVSITDCQTGEFLETNAEAIRVSGFSREEIIGHTALELGWITMENRQILLQTLVKDGRIVNLEMDFKAKDGSVVIGLVCGELVDISGKECLLTVTVDITSRKRNEQALLASMVLLDANEKKYRELYEGLNDAFVQVDLNGQITQFNNAFLDLLGYSAAEIAGMNLFDITPKRWHESQREMIEKGVAARQRSQVYEKEYIKKDGSLLAVELRVSLVCSSEQEPEAMWAIVRDITERKTSENELARYNEKLESLVEARTRQLQAEIVERERFEKELTQRTAQLELFNKAMIDREMRIIEMKKEVNGLCNRLGIELEYDEFWKLG